VTAATAFRATGHTATRCVLTRVGNGRASNDGRSLTIWLMSRKTGWRIPSGGGQPFLAKDFANLSRSRPGSGVIERSGAEITANERGRRLKYASYHREIKRLPGVINCYQISGRFCCKVFPPKRLLILLSAKKCYQTTPRKSGYQTCSLRLGHRPLTLPFGHINLVVENLWIELEFAGWDSDNWLHRKTRGVRLFRGMPV
jgi:hypothetical protein